MRRARLPRTVIVLGVASLLTDLSSEMIYPLLPAFLATLLGAGAIALGTVEGAAEATASLLKIVSGTVADRVRRKKPLVVSGYAVSGVARPLIGFAWAWPVVLALRVLDRVGKGIRTSPRDALIADTTPEDRRGRAYGLHRAMDNAGAVLGPLAAALLLGAGLDTRHVFWLAALPGVAVMLVLVLGVREAPRAPRQSSDPRIGGAHLGGDFKRLLLVIVVFTLGNSSDTFLLLRLGGVGLDPAHVALAWSGHSVVRTIAVLVGGRYADRVERRRLLAVGWIVYAAVYAAMALTRSPAALVGLLFAYGLYYGATEPTERAIVADLAPPSLRGGAFGWYHGAVGLTALPASALFGVLWYELGPAAAFGTGAALAVVATVGLATLTPSRPAGA